MGFLFGLLGVLALMGGCAVAEDIIDSWKGWNK